MVANGRHHNGKCCFDHGNAETSNLDAGNGPMEAIYFRNCEGCMTPGYPPDAIEDAVHANSVAAHRPDGTLPRMRTIILPSGSHLGVASPGVRILRPAT